MRIHPDQKADYALWIHLGFLNHSEYYLFKDDAETEPLEYARKIKLFGRSLFVSSETLFSQIREPGSLTVVATGKGWNAIMRYSPYTGLRTLELNGDEATFLEDMMMLGILVDTSEKL